MKALLLIYTLGTLTDYWTTAWAIPRGAPEWNQAVARLIEMYGVEALLYLKIIAVVIACFVVWIIKQEDKLIARITGETCKVGYLIAFVALWMMTLVQWLVVGSNFWQMRIAMALGW